MKLPFRKLIRLLALGLALFLMVPQISLGADLNYDADTTITVGSTNYTILSGSGATSVIVGSSTVTVTVPSGSTWTLRSTNRYPLSNSGSLSQSCTDAYNQLAISGPQTSIVITPDTSTTCTVPSTSSGGGGGLPAEAYQTPTPPAGGFSMVVNSNAATTGSRQVTLTLNGGPNTTQMAIANDANFTGAGIEPYQATRSWVLTSGNGTKTVYAKFYTRWGQPSSAINDAIVYQEGAIVPATSANMGVHANGTLVLDGKTVYLIKNGKRYGFRNPDEYKSHGYNFAQVVIASDADKSLPLEAAVNKALEGTLVIDSSDNRTVYMIGVNGTKRGFTSADVFTKLGYTFKNLPKINLTDYPSGAPIGSSTEAHPEGALVLDGKTVWWIREGKKQGFESTAVFNTYGFSFSKVVKANSADLLVPSGPLVKFRDGTLVKDGSDYYLISDGNKLKFGSVTILTAKGYKTSNAITASLANYTAGEVIQ